jgi:hypothetical protein
MDVRADDTLRRGTLCLFRGGSLASLTEDVYGLFDFAGGFDQGRAAIRETRPGAVAQLLHKLRRDTLLRCSHKMHSVPSVCWYSDILG